jgi:hypothetical protein
MAESKTIKTKMSTFSRGKYREYALVWREMTAEELKRVKALHASPATKDRKRRKTS